MQVAAKNEKNNRPYSHDVAEFELVMQVEYLDIISFIAYKTIQKSVA